MPIPDESPGSEHIARNYSRVRDEVEAAARASGRAPESVRIVGVTKTVDAAAAAALYRAGCRDLGENRPEELVRKAADPGLAGVVWHLIGTYQRRKVRDTLAAPDWIHSIDSIPLLSAIAARAETLGRVGAKAPRLLLQINVSGEESKGGFSPAELPVALAAAESAGLRPVGLMTMAPLDPACGSPGDVFRALRLLRDRFASDDLPLTELSMGMSGDFVEAIREGATIVRIGTALFRS